MGFRILKKSEMKVYSGGTPGLSGVYMGPGEKAKLAQFLFKKGASVGTHTHPGEQVSYIIRGKLKVVVAGKEFVVKGEESYLIPPGIEHSMEALEETESIDVWAPPTY